MKATQTERLLDLLRESGERGVTPLDALDRIGSFRLGARIWDLKAQGYTIESHRIKMASGAIVARYVLRESVVPPPPQPTFRLSARGAAKIAALNEPIRPCPSCGAPLGPTDTHFDLLDGPAGAYVCPVPIEPNGQVRAW